MSRQIENKNHLQTLKLVGEIKELVKLHKFMHKCGKIYNIDHIILFDIELAADEAVTNVMEHGLRGESCRIDLSFEKKNGKYVIVITDNAPPFNQSAPTYPNLSPDVTKREAGGLGVYLIHKIMDNISYTYKDGKNILTLEKNYNSQ